MKLTYSNFNSETGESVVILQNRNGRYVGKAKLHPEDREFASEFAGCRIAEQRAWLDFYKTELKKTKIQLKTLENIWNDIIWYCEKDEENYLRSILHFGYRIFIKIKYYEKYKRELEDNIVEVKKEIDDSIKTRDKIIQKCKKGEFN